jgi:hypothetical protein
MALNVYVFTIMSDLYSCTTVHVPSACDGVPASSSPELAPTVVRPDHFDDSNDPHSGGSALEHARKLRLSCAAIIAMPIQGRVQL